MKKITTLLFLLFSSLGFSQDLTCADFKEGEFIMYSTIDNQSIVYKVTRSGNKQTEDILRAPKEMTPPDFQKTFYIKLKWIDDCNYRTYLDESQEAGEIFKLMNDNNGVLVEKTKIEGKCFYYKSSWILDGKEMSLNGRLCKKVK